MRKLLTYLFIALTLSMTVCSCSKSKPRNIATNEADLDGKNIAVILGTVQDIYVSQRLPNANIQRLNSATEVLLSLEKRRAEYALLDEISILTLDLEKRGIQSCSNDSTIGGDVAFAFNKENGQDLCQQFNAFLAELKKTGAYDTIQSRWLRKDIKHVKMPDIELPFKGEPLRIGTSSEDIPLSFVKDNKWAGMEIEILTRFAQKLGRPIQFQDYSFPGMMAALSTNKVDIIGYCIFITEERKGKVLFSDPYYRCGTACLTYIDDHSSEESISFVQRVKDGFRKNFLEEDRWQLLLKGLWKTLVISFWSIIFGTLLGTVVCALRRSRNKWINKIGKVYVSLMSGIPLLVFLMVMFYVVFSSSTLTATWVAIFAFSFNFAAFSGEIFNTGLSSVDNGQNEAGRALGFSKIKCFFLIIAPQALKKVLPLYKNEAISLIKNTSIVGYIAIQDLTKISDLIRSRTFDAFFPLIVITIIYLLLAWLFTFALKKLAEKL